MFERFFKKLKPGEVICPKCKGKGFTKEWDATGYRGPYTCTRCAGDGVLDWVSFCFGDRPRKVFDYDNDTQCCPDYEPKKHIWCPFIPKGIVSGKFSQFVSGLTKRAFVVFTNKR